MSHEARTGSDAAPQTVLVGRQREQRALQTLLDAAIAGRGSLVLVSGEAGIGKTTLVRDLAAQAVRRDCLVLTGACYDTGVTSAYEPWREIANAAARRVVPGSSLPAAADWLTQAPSANAAVVTLRRTLDELVQQGPLLIILEDIHWADPESLEFLRFVARQLHEQPLLIIATYRDTDLHINDTLHLLLPQLVREANAERIALHALDADAITALVNQRYRLPPDDQNRLTKNLAERSHGVPFYLLELLRTLEDDEQLRLTADGWTIGEIDQTRVPLLVKQVIDARLVGLGANVRRLLELAAVVGQESSLILLRRGSDLDEDDFAEALDRARQRRLLISDATPLTVQFAHALVRDSLYEDTPLSQRQRWHRRIAELLADDGNAQPAIVAHHFRQALDPRAAGWFIRAGQQSERVAWLTAAAHFDAALEMMGTGEGDSGERGWLLARRAGPLRNTEPRTSLALLETAEALAIEANDAGLLAFVTLMRGHIRCLSGEIRPGIADLEAGVDALGRLSPEDIERVEQRELQGDFMSRLEADGLLAATLATVGRVREALERADATIARADDIPIRAWWAHAIALALEGRPREATEAFMICRGALQAASEYSTTATLILYQISLVQIPYGADDLAERQRTIAAGQAAWQRSGAALGDVSPRLTSVPVLLLEGEWQAVRELTLSGIESSDSNSEKNLIAAVHLARVAREQGDTSLAWHAVHKLLPAGIQTIPGQADFAISLALFRVAVSLCLDAGDLAAAHAWLEAHDRWLAWSGTVLGQADSHLCWAHIYRYSGDLARMRHHTTQALALARAPRQPLALLAAYRLQGELETQIGQFSNARQHLNAALTLAEACAATYERALTLLAFADLQRRAHSPVAATGALQEARAIFEKLGAIPALRLAETMAARLDDGAAVEPLANIGLTPREVEVLRLLANGASNRVIADELFLSVRTVERHITNVYAKIGATGRSEAIAFAHAYHLHEGPHSAK